MVWPIMAVVGGKLPQTEARSFATEAVHCFRWRRSWASNLLWVFVWLTSLVWDLHGRSHRVFVLLVSPVSDLHGRSHRIFVLLASPVSDLHGRSHRVFMWLTSPVWDLHGRSHSLRVAQESGLGFAQPFTQRAGIRRSWFSCCNCLPKVVWVTDSAGGSVR